MFTLVVPRSYVPSGSRLDSPLKGWSVGLNVVIFSLRSFSLGRAQGVWTDETHSPETCRRSRLDREGPDTDPVGLREPGTRRRGTPTTA